jgi:hypothetical protein
MPKAEHDSKIAVYCGQEKTIELIWRNFYWPKMDQWLIDYMWLCHECQCNKSSRHAQYGLV